MGEKMFQTKIDTAAPHKHQTPEPADYELGKAVQSGPLSPKSIIALQRQIGNNAVQRLFGLDEKSKKKRAQEKSEVMVIDKNVIINGSLQVSHPAMFSGGIVGTIPLGPKQEI